MAIFPNFQASYIKLPEELFEHVHPSRVPQQQLMVYNNPLALELGFPFRENHTKEIADLLSGNSLPKELTPYAQAYAGHQFGYFNKLGDGRAILLGEVLTKNKKRVDIQLKGAGRTPFSRNGDGKATLSSMLREYLISEAMYALNIPTSRSLAVVCTGETVRREKPHRGAILTRVASSHIRVGTFEYAYQMKDHDVLKKLADYTIDRHYPELHATENPYLSLLEKVIDQQIDLVVNWMRVGFIHGVMNTDNVTISGETIDYGPCAFMNTYNPKTVFSSIDTQGRYAFGNQPKITHWNMTCLAGALLPLLHENEKIAIDQAQQLLDTFPKKYEHKWTTMFCSKLGLNPISSENKQLINDLLDWMEQKQADYTNTFVDLQSSPFPTEAIYQDTLFKTWHSNWLNQIKQENKTLEEAQHTMKKVNPSLIPRNYWVEKSLEKAAEDLDFDLFNSLLEATTNPYTIKEGHLQFTIPPHDDDLGYQTFCGT